MGGFIQQATTFATGQSPASVITGDFNGDGITDIATANMGGGNVTLLLGVASSTSPQTITFGPLSNVSLSADSVTVSATASSELLVSFTSTTTTVCTVSGNTVTLLTAGTCTIVASQAGNSSYSAATNVPQSFTVSGGGGNSPPPPSLLQPDDLICLPPCQRRDSWLRADWLVRHGLLRSAGHLQFIEPGCLFGRWIFRHYPDGRHLLHHRHAER